MKLIVVNSLINPNPPAVLFVGGVIEAEWAHSPWSLVRIQPPLPIESKDISREEPKNDRKKEFSNMDKNEILVRICLFKDGTL